MDFHTDKYKFTCIHILYTYIYILWGLAGHSYWTTHLMPTGATGPIVPRPTESCLVPWWGIILAELCRLMMVGEIQVSSIGGAPISGNPQIMIY